MSPPTSSTVAEDVRADLTVYSQICVVSFVLVTHLNKIFYAYGASCLPQFLLLLHLFCFSTKSSVNVYYVYFCVIYSATLLGYGGYMLVIET